MRLSNQIVLASLNRGKLDEFSELFSGYPDIEIVSVDGLVRNAEKLEFVEIYDTYLDNCAAKARLANHGCHYPALADDTGLEVDALGGKPGVRTRRYASITGQAPLSNVEQDRANIEFLLSELKKVGATNRSARFVTVLCLVVEGIMLHATGTLEGTIADHPRGSHGFGYDSVFIPKGSSKTLAEMSETEKNALSHRAKAVQELMHKAQERGIVLAKP